jgi:tetratricopeptide (TPR) repeat protein
MTSSSGMCVACGERIAPGARACSRGLAGEARAPAVRRWAAGGCQPPLAGRSALLGRLKELAEEARRGLGRVVWLMGEAGLGKSRLKDALVEALAGQDFEVWEGSGMALPGTPGGPFRELLDATRGMQPPAGVGRVSSAEAEVLARFVGGRERHGIPASLTSERTALFDAVCHALMPHRQPRLLILEDWQHADPLSHALVEVLVSRLCHTPLLLLVLQRPGGTAPVPLPAAVLTVGPLAPDEAATLVDSRPGGALAPEVREALLQGCAGHPLHLLHALRLHEAHPEAPPRAGEAALAARLEGLAPSWREAIQAASVLGPSFPRPVLAALVGGDTPLAALEAGGWLRGVAGGRCAWTASLPERPSGTSVRGAPALHRQAAEAYEALPAEPRRRACVELVRHWLSAEQPARALPHLVELARWHCAALEPAPALAVYRFALDLTPSLEDFAATGWRRELWERIGDAHRLAGEKPEAEAAWRTARSLDVSGPPPVPADRARRLHKLAAVVLALGGHLEVVALGEEGRHEGVDAMPTQAAALDAVCALALCALGRFEQARARVHLARERLLREPPEDGPARAGVEAVLHRAMGDVLMGLGQPKAATSEYAAVLRWSERAGDSEEHSRALFNLGDAHARAGNRERATHYFQLALDLKARTGDRWGMAYIHHGLALLHTQADAPELAKEDAVRGLQLAAMLGDRKLKSALRCALGRAQLRLGEVTEAARQLQLAAQDAAAAGARPEQRQAEAVLRALDARR